MRIFLFEIFFTSLVGCSVMHPIEYNSPMKSKAESTPFKGKDCGLNVTYRDDAANFQNDFHEEFKKRGYGEVSLADHPSFTLEITARNLVDEHKNWARLNLRRVGVIVFKQSWKVSEVKKEDTDESTIDRHGLVERVIAKIPKCEDAWKLGEGSSEEL